MYGFLFQHFAHFVSTLVSGRVGQAVSSSCSQSGVAAGQPAAAATPTERCLQQSPATWKHGHRGRFPSTRRWRWGGSGCSRAASQMGRRAAADGGRAVRSPGRRWRRARAGPDAQDEGRQHDDLAVGLRFLCWPRAQRRLLQLFEEMGVCTCVVHVLRRSCKKHSFPFFYLLSGRGSIRCCHGRSLPFHRSGGLGANQLRHRSDVH
jgi:hypothetical protein